MWRARRTVSVYVLVAIIKKRLNLELSLYTILQMLSVTFLEKVSILQVLTENGYRTEWRLLKPNIGFFEIIKAFLLYMSKLTIDTDFCHYTDKRGDCYFIQLPWPEWGCCCHKNLKQPPFVTELKMMFYLTN